MATGLLLINLGTPEAPTTSAVRRYLREFLSDPRVLDINPVGRFLLLNAIILPFRSPKSAAAYRTIWDPERGSPLLFHSQGLRDKVAAELGPAWHVELGMRYGSPSLSQALEALTRRALTKIVLLPLYPQHAASTTGSSLQAVMDQASSQWNVPSLAVVPPFFERAPYLDAVRDVSAPHLADFAPDHVLFSFHGLPERHIHKSDPTGAHCLRVQGCCETLTEANAYCYRAQAFATAASLAQRLELDQEHYSVGFQSRLGKTPWIGPYTEDLLRDLGRRGVRRLAVLCPSFVADCLETLEEIAERGAEAFAEHGGGELRLIPSLNQADVWARAVADLARTQSLEGAA